MFSHEKELFLKGYKTIVGIDEVGRGCLAGPMAVGCVIIDLKKLIDIYQEIQENKTSNNFWINDIKDSKKLSQKKRENLNILIKNFAIKTEVYFIENTLIDQNGISWAEKFGFSEALKKTNIMPDFVLTDAFMVPTVNKAFQKNIIGGDAVSFTIAAASIVAKVTRDNYMVEQHIKWPEFGFDKHKGYGTSHHIKMIKEHGICEIHRKSFEPIKSFYN